MNIIAGLATIPEREESLKKTVYSIYNQVDFLFIELNNYINIPSWLNDNKIKAEIHDNSLGDAVKFLHINEAQKYFFSIDDDLIYPSNYAEYMINGILKHNSIVTLHGRIYPIPVDDFRKWSFNYRCLSNVYSDICVNFGGTGVMAFDIESFCFGMDIFKEKNMADCYVAREAYLRNMPIFVLKHNANYLKYQKPKLTIWRSNNKSYKQTEILKSFLK